MPHRHAVTDITAGHTPRNVQNRPVLYIRARTDADFMHIAAHLHAEPDGGVRADLHIARDARVRRDKRAFMNFWQNAFIGKDQSGHGTFYKGLMLLETIS